MKGVVYSYTSYQFWEKILSLVSKLRLMTYLYMSFTSVKWNDTWFSGNIILHDRKKWGAGMSMLSACKQYYPSKLRKGK